MIGAAQATPARSGALGLAYGRLLAGGNIAVDFGADADFGHYGFMPHIDNPPFLDSYTFIDALYRTPGSRREMRAVRRSPICSRALQMSRLCGRLVWFIDLFPVPVTKARALRGQDQ